MEPQPAPGPAPPAESTTLDDAAEAAAAPTVPTTTATVEATTTTTPTETPPAPMMPGQAVFEALFGIKCRPSPLISPAASVGVEDSAASAKRGIDSVDGGAASASEGAAAAVPARPVKRPRSMKYRCVVHV